jgi:hypothetical protein
MEEIVLQQCFGQTSELGWSKRQQWCLCKNGLVSTSILESRYFKNAFGMYSKEYSFVYLLTLNTSF